MFGWNSTQFGESDDDENSNSFRKYDTVDCIYSQSSHFFVSPSNDRLGIFNENGLIGRPGVIGV